MSHINNFNENGYATNSYLNFFEDAGKTQQIFSKSQPDFEKTVYNDLGNDKRNTLDVKEFTTNHLGDDFGSMGQEEIMTGLQKEKCLSSNRLSDETNLEETKRQHSKTNEEYFDIYLLEGKAGYQEEAVIGNMETKRSKKMKSAGTGKIGPVHSGKKAKLNEVSRRQHDPKHLATSKKDFVDNDGKSSSPSFSDFSNDTRFGVGDKDQNEEDMLFSKLKSIGKLSLTETDDSFPSLITHCKNIKCEVNILHVPELHFDEVADTESPINKNQVNDLEENKTRKIDGHRLSIPKEAHKSETGRFKGKAMKAISKKDIDKGSFNQWKTQNKSESQVKGNESQNILGKRSATGKRGLRNSEETTHVTESKKDEEDYLLPSVVDDLDTLRDDAVKSPSYNFPSLSNESSSSEFSFRANSTEPPGERVNTFQEFERQNLAERKDVKKQFRLKIAEAKKILFEARLTAQEQTATKRFNEALKKHTEIKVKRAFMKAESSSKFATPTLADAASSSSALPIRKTFKDVSISDLSAEASSIQEIRKAEADFDRAKVKQIQTKMTLQKKNLSKTTDPQPSKKLNSVKKKDRERLERYEVDKMISELRSLNMMEYADKLSQAIASKDEYEAKLRDELNQERKLAAQLAKKQKSEELARIRQEEKRKKMAKKERLEQERKEMEALEIAKRQAEAMKRREHNLKLQESLNYTLLATDMSRSFTYSYLPKLKTPQTAQVEKNDKNRLKKVKARYLQGL
ncbi:trichohyalin-like [Actinia tenebrosa]|uniref:Trichohyalin-like n=1 Tax=Actinia tenebrosa TaxID=6105 RepID=A0A6P8HI14_ACTTE|nr:trichohyalin-like [Actinia tenebrosa]